MKEYYQKIVVALFPIFIAFTAGNWVGTTISYNSIIKDCEFTNKARYGNSIIKCERLR